MTNYLSIKLFKKTEPILNYVQAHLQLKRRKKISEAETIAYILMHLAVEHYAYKKE